MKKIILLILAIAGCSMILMFLYNQQKNANLIQELEKLPEEVVNDIDQAHESLAKDSEEDDEESLQEKIDSDMTQIEKTYQKNTHHPMPDDIKEAIEESLEEEIE